MKMENQKLKFSEETTIAQNFEIYKTLLIHLDGCFLQKLCFENIPEWLPRKDSVP